MKSFQKIALAMIAAAAATAASNAQNINGRITCDGAGVQGVAVSDGYVVTLTDADGNYSFTSQKKTDMCSTRFHEDTSRPLPTISFLNFGSNCRRPMSVPPKPTISHSTRWTTTTT